MKKHLSNLGLFSACVILIGSLLFAWSSQGRNDVFIFGYKPFLVATGSMEPLYPVNSLVIIHESDVADIEIGDVIAFHSPMVNGQIVFHRVVDKVDQGFITKGDNNSEVDQFIVQKDDFVGTSTFHTSFTVVVIQLLNQPVKLFLYVILPMLALLVMLFGIQLWRKSVQESSDEA